MRRHLRKMIFFIMLLLPSVVAMAQHRTLFIGNSVVRHDEVVNLWPAVRGMAASVNGLDLVGNVMLGRTGRYDGNISGYGYDLFGGNFLETDFPKYSGKYADAQPELAKELPITDGNRYDAIVISLGENVRGSKYAGEIVSDGGTLTSQLNKACTSFLRYLHEKCPNAKMVWLIGSAWNDFVQGTNTNVNTVDGQVLTAIQNAIFNIKRSQSGLRICDFATCYHASISAQDFKNDYFGTNNDALWRAANNLKNVPDWGDIGMLKTNDYVISQTLNDFHAITNGAVLQHPSDIGMCYLAKGALEVLKAWGVPVQTTDVVTLAMRTLTLKSDGYVTLSSTYDTGTTPEGWSIGNWVANGVANLNLDYTGSNTQWAELYNGLKLTDPNGNVVTYNGSPLTLQKQAVGNADHAEKYTFYASQNLMVTPQYNPVQLSDQNKNTGGSYTSGNPLTMLASNSNTAVINHFDATPVVQLMRNVGNTANWNTVCLPFDLSADEIKDIFGDAAQVRQYSKLEASGSADAAYLEVVFGTVTEMKAGVPYLVKASKAVTSPVTLSGKTFSVKSPLAVSYSATIGGVTYTCDFQGIYDQTPLPDGDQSYLYIASNKFYYPSGTTPMKGFRAYFHISQGNAAKAKMGLLIDGITAISNAHVAGKQHSGVIYSIDGKAVGKDLNGLQKGIYIKDDKKIVK